MTSTWTSRMGGNAMLWGGLLWVVSMFLHPTFTSVETAAAANRSLWVLIHWAYLVGDTLIIAGLVLFVRHVAAGTAGETAGWATLALAFGAMGFTLDAVSTSIHLLAFPPVVSGTDAASLQTAFIGAGAVNQSTGSAGFAMASLSLIVLGVVAGRMAWAGVLAYVAIIVGILELALILISSFTGAVLLPAGLTTTVVNALMPASFALLGWRFAASGNGASLAGAA